MSAQTRFVALLALCWAGSATAQAAPAERTWTDPPARGTVAAPAARPAPEAPKVTRAPEPRPVSRAAGRPAKPRVAAVHRRPALVVRTLTPTRPGSRSTPVHVVHARVPRVAGPVRPASTRAAFARPVRDHGFVAPPPPPGGFALDPRVRRIRQAEAAGYLVVRRSTVAAPDGRLLYGYRPYEADDAED